MLLTKEQIKREFEDYKNSNHCGLKSGINALDDIIRMDTKNLCVITAKPNQGKSTFLTFYAYRMALNHNWKTLYFNYESANGRFISDLVKLYGNINEVIEHCIIADVTSIKSLDEIYNTIAEANKTYNIQMVIIDPFMRLNAYIQDINTYSIGAILTNLQQMAIKEDLLMCVVAHPTKLKTDEEVQANSIMGSTYFYTTADFMLTMQIVDQDNMITEFKTLKIRNNFDQGLTDAKCELQYDPMTKQYCEVDEDIINDIPFSEKIARKIVKEHIENEIKDQKENETKLSPKERLNNNTEQLPIEDEKTQQKANKEQIQPFNIDDIKMAVYKNCNMKVASKIVTLKEATKLGYEQKDLIDEIRVICDEKKEGWEQKKRELKLKLQCYTPSKNGYNRQLRDNNEYNNIISFDIDEKDNKIPMGEIWRKLIEDKYTLYCGLSASGKGIYGFYIGNGNINDYAAQYNAMIKHLNKMGINADTACGDITRLRFCSYDKDEYWNKTPEPFLLKSEEANKTTPSQYNNKSNCESTERAQLDEKEKEWFYDAINEIIDNKLSITNNHEESRAVGQELAYYFGEDGLIYYLIIRKQRKGYDEQISTQKYYNICRWIVSNNDYKREGHLQTIRHFYNKAVEKENEIISHIDVAQFKKPNTL